MDTILVPYNPGSPKADKALRHAARLARRTGARLHLLYVLEHEALLAEGTGGDPGRAVDERTERVARRLDELIFDLRREGVRAVRLILRGEIGREVRRYARSLKADIVIFGVAEGDRELHGGIVREIIGESEMLVMTV